MQRFAGGSLILLKCLWQKTFMKIKLFLGVLSLAGLLSAETIETIVERNQKTALPAYPETVPVNFAGLQKKAVAGDDDAYLKVPQISITRIWAVYKVLSAHRGLLFSVRKPVRGYDTAKNNYAVNIEEFFAATSDGIRIKKNGFDVCTSNGVIYSVTGLNYSPADSSIEVKNGSVSSRISLNQLTAADRRFVENALQDEIFDSSSSFLISSQDARSDGESKQGDKVSGTYRATGEKVSGAFSSSSENKLSRKIILENKGSLPLENLVIEYQSFAEQTLMKWPSDFHDEYCYAGYFEVKSLAPGAKKELDLTALPVTVNAKQESINTGTTEYSVVIPAGLNKQSEGRMNGIRMRVHRFTPYGERLTREYKSAGVPSLEWSCVAPTTAELKK